MKNVRENFYEKILTYVFNYGGVSINTIWVRDTFAHPVLFSIVLHAVPIQNGNAQ